MIKIKKDLLRNIFLYIIIGMLASISDFLVFIFFTSFELPIYITNALSNGTGLLISFTLNRKYNFKISSKRNERFIKFASVSIVNYILNTTIIYILHDYKFNLVLAKIISIGISAIFQFLLVNFWVFARQEKTNFFHKCQ
jgi:putative flippase GtrA